MTITVLIIAFAVLLLALTIGVAAGGIGRWARRKEQAADPDPVIADTRDSFDVK